MVLSGAEKLGTADSLACLRRLVAVPKQAEDQKEMQRLAKKHPARADVHFVVMTDLKVLDEGGTGRLNKALELMPLNLCQRRAPESSLLEGATIPMHKR